MSVPSQQSRPNPAQEEEQTEDPSFRLFEIENPESPTRSECISQGYINLPLGKQCSHPANVWFRDPRQVPPQLRSRAAILQEVFQRYTPMNSYYRATLASYADSVEPLFASHKGRKVMGGKDGKARSFPQFLRLPLELRWQIWRLAVPPRILNIGQLHLSDPIDIRNLQLHVPHIALVCREARDVIFRMGTKLVLEQSIGGVRKRSPSGFMTSCDVPFYSYGCRDVETPREDRNHTDSATYVNEAFVAQTLGCRAAAVHWFSPMEAFRAHSPRAAGFFDSRVREWGFLRDCNLESLLVLFRAPVSLYLGLDWDFYHDQLRKEGMGISDDVEEAVTQLLVDLYDDQLLAEVTSLETIRSSSSRPRYIADYIPQKLGLCLNCERVQWEEHHRVWVEHFWLHFYAYELDDWERQIVFPQNGIYKPDHPWVQDKLRDAPQFRPAIFIYLHFRDARDGNDDEDESSYIGCWEGSDESE